MPSREPAVWIGIIFSVAAFAITALVGEGVMQEDIGQTILMAIDPTKGGWLIPIVIGVITRFFVSPADHIGLK